jgi:hypothetical protein
MELLSNLDLLLLCTYINNKNQYFRIWKYWKYYIFFMIHKFFPWKIDFRPITTTIKSSVRANVYCCLWNLTDLWGLHWGWTAKMINYNVTCDRSLSFSVYSDFLHQSNWPTRYNWNIVESGVTKPNLTKNIIFSILSYSEIVSEKKLSLLFCINV